MNTYNLEGLLLKDEINGEELEQLLIARKKNEIDFLLIDVREKHEYEEKRIKGVDYLIPLSDLHNKLQVINEEKEKPIISQCRIGARSATAQTQMHLLGFEKVINMAGGITHYKGEVI